MTLNNSICKKYTDKYCCNLPWYFNPIKKVGIAENYHGMAYNIGPWCNETFFLCYCLNGQIS